MSSPLYISIMDLHVQAAPPYSDARGDEDASKSRNAKSFAGRIPGDVGAGRLCEEVFAVGGVAAGISANARLADQRLRLLSGYAQQGCARRRRNRAASIRAGCVARDSFLYRSRARGAGVDGGCHFGEPVACAG